MSVSLKLEQRQTRRLLTNLSAIVKVKEDKDAFCWQQEVELINISPNGASFYLERKREVGQMVSLLMSPSPEMRRYDFQKKLYRVWGLVQHYYQTSLDGNAVYYIGVAFTGKFAPPGHRANPSQSYRICGMNENGFWTVTAVPTPFVARKARRIWVSVKVSLELVDVNGNATVLEKTKTENISSHGAAVFSNMNLNVGSCIKFSSEEFDFSSLAIVRNSQKKKKDRHRRVHLEFLTEKFPTDKISLPCAPN